MSTISDFVDLVKPLTTEIQFLIFNHVITQNYSLNYLLESLDSNDVLQEIFPTVLAETTNNVTIYIDDSDTLHKCKIEPFNDPVLVKSMNFGKLVEFLEKKNIKLPKISFHDDEIVELIKGNVNEIKRLIDLSIELVPNKFSRFDMGLENIEIDDEPLWRRCWYSKISELNISSTTIPNDDDGDDDDILSLMTNVRLLKVSIYDDCNLNNVNRLFEFLQPSERLVIELHIPVVSQSPISKFLNHIKSLDTRMRMTSRTTRKLNVVVKICNFLTLYNIEEFSEAIGSLKQVFKFVTHITVKLNLSSCKKVIRGGDTEPMTVLDIRPLIGLRWLEVLCQGRTKTSGLLNLSCDSLIYLRLHSLSGQLNYNFTGSTSLRVVSLENCEIIESLMENLPNCIDTLSITECHVLCWKPLLLPRDLISFQFISLLRSFPKFGNLDYLVNLDQVTVKCRYDMSEFLGQLPETVKRIAISHS